MPKTMLTETDKRAGLMIRTRRVELGLSQEQLGKAIGVAFQQIQKYERGTNRVSASRLDQFAKILKVPVTYFFAGGVADAPPSALLYFLANRQGRALSEAFMALPSNKMRSLVLGLIRAVAKEARR